MNKYTKEYLVSIFLMFAGAYSFIMGFKYGKAYMYVIGVLLFFAAYMIRSKIHPRKKSKR
jgi:hypothetical protein